MKTTKNNKQNWDGKIVTVKCVRGAQSGLMLRGRYFRVSASHFDLMLSGRTSRFSFAETEISLVEEIKVSAE